MTQQTKPKDPVRTYYCPISRVTAKDIQQMYELYSSI